MSEALPLDNTSMENQQIRAEIRSLFNEMDRAVERMNRDQERIDRSRERTLAILAELRRAA